MIGTNLIGARIASGLSRRLTAKAGQLATTHAENTIRSAHRDSGRWRNARLLWPLFVERG